MSSILKSRVGTRPAGASFAENFYGLKRRRALLFKTDRARSAVGGVFPEEKLREREILRSLLFLVRVLLWGAMGRVVEIRNFDYT